VRTPTIVRPITAVMAGAILSIVAAGCGGTPPPFVADPPTPAADAVSQAGSMSMDMGNNAASMTVTQMDSMMAAQMKSFPVKTDGLGGQPMQPKILADGTKEFDLTAAVSSWQVDATKTVQAWLYNGTFPGPSIHVNVGDHVKVVFTNHLPESTAIHFHGVQGVPNGMDGVPGVTQDAITPGQTFTYTFIPTAVGVGMYHSHDDTLKQLTDGLMGVFQVGEEPLPKGVTVSQELAFVLEDSGPIGMSFNGKSFPATAPVVAHVGEDIEVNYFNAGQMIHPIHLHGPGQLVIAKDGYPLASPEMEDTITVAPGERYTVLIRPDLPGVWVWHCHILAHAELASGLMYGMVTALVVK
jgi:FtsP/CotA-like multicopper oxidase with cupredoxin domain